MDGVGPAEPAEPSQALLRALSESDSDFGIGFRICAFNTALARQGAGRIEPAERYTASPVFLFGIMPASKCANEKKERRLWPISKHAASVVAYFEMK